MKDADLARIKAAYALSKIPQTLASDVLSNGDIEARFGFDAHISIELADDLVIRQEDLFSAFRQACASGATTDLADENGAKCDCQVYVRSDGVGVLETADRVYRFDYVGLLLSDEAKRNAALAMVLLRNTLSLRDEENFRKLVGTGPLSDDRFLATMSLLGSSPEAYVSALSERAGSGRLRVWDFLPKDSRYWDHLLPPPANSTDLLDYILGELAERRARALSSNPSRAYLTDSLLFSAPMLVPILVYQQLDAERCASMVESALDLDDHFALVGTFEVCASWVRRDARFSVLGERALDRLFADFERLEAVCNVFTAAFAIATSHLAKHESLRQRPAYWRRLAAASHAALTVRTLGPSGFKEESLVRWAMGKVGKEYFYSAISDMAALPRWRPEWATWPYLVADALGRVRNACRSLAEEALPKEWAERVRAAETWIEKEDLEPLTVYPAIMEGGLPAPDLDLSQFESITGAYQRLVQDASVDAFLPLSHFLYCAGAPPGGSKGVFAVLKAVRADRRRLDDTRVRAALSLSASLAIHAKDKSLADAIVNACLERARIAGDADTALACILHLIECTSAELDHESAAKELAVRLETLVSMLPAQAVSDDVLDALQAIRRTIPNMRFAMAKSIAAARLARSGRSV